MAEILLLNNTTIDKIAAGEVVERPLNVVKELVENSIDAGSTIISLEIKSGGIEYIRITDNGKGIDNSQVKMAFLRHATSKLSCVEDLETLTSMGFRGEALSSISAVSKTEMITKTADSLLGTRVCIEGSKITEMSEIGAPCGTTVIVRNLFYNTPVRRKFLKSPSVEGAMVEDLIQKLAMSHPEIAFHFTINSKVKLETSGNGSLKDVLYRIYSKELFSVLLNINYEIDDLKIEGFIAKPQYTVSTREGEITFVNHRYVHSKMLTLAIEEGFSGFLMQHRFPFCVINISINPNKIDINVHPQKAEVRFTDPVNISDALCDSVKKALKSTELIPKITLDNCVTPDKTVESDKIITSDNSIIQTDDAMSSSLMLNESKNDYVINVPDKVIEKTPEPFETKRLSEIKPEPLPVFEESDFFTSKLIDDTPIRHYKVIGQIFETYWLITLDDNLYIVDQHAAHEKVNYENFVKFYTERESAESQILYPARSIHLSAKEASILSKNLSIFEKIGFEIDEMGQNSFAIRSVPVNLFGFDQSDFFVSLLNELVEKEKIATPMLILEKIASMSCKAAIKGNMRITAAEMEVLMEQLMKLDNPYNCPHGRPVFISISKNELEHKFKRIV